MDPCECLGDCGWDTASEACMAGGETDCQECPTVEFDCLCHDEILNQDEIEVDCGGDICVKCNCVNDDSVRDSFGDTCSSWYDTNKDDCGGYDDSDFVSNERCCQCGGGLFPMCEDGILNQDETDIDCGGENCGPCVEDPCSCPDGTGYSTSDGACMEGSTTECYECVTMDGCMEGSCDTECYEFDPMKTCQCLDGNCDDYDTCCEDQSGCLAPECVYTDCTDAECCEGYECTDRVNPLTGATNRQCVETEEDPCYGVDCGDMGERYECDTSDAVKHFDGTGVCVRDNNRPEMYTCMPNYIIESCDMGEMCNEETNMCEMEEEKEEFKHMGRGECVDEYERSPPNMSADGMDLYECKYACMMHEDCKAVSHSRGNRCAMWMDSEKTPEDYPPFQGHGGNGSKKGSCMRGGNGVGNWDCWVRDGRYCEKESKESESEEMEYETCEESLWGMTMHLSELQQHAEQCMEDYEMASRMFQDCLDNDLTGEEWECHDYDYWMDKEGRDCAAYEYLGMCEYNYLTIYADEKE
eukprot:UN22296